MQGRWLALTLVGGFAGYVAACGGAGAFGCVQSSQCVDGSVEGLCQPDGFCSFPADDCNSGQRFGEFGPMAGECVPVDDATSGAATSDTGATDPTDPVLGSTSGPADTSQTSPDDSTGVVDPDTGDADSSSGGPPLPDPVTVSFGERDDSDVTHVTRDTFVADNQMANNWGSHNDLHFGDNDGQVTLIAFELTAIPPGSIVESAELRVVVEEEAPNSPEGVLSLYPLLEAWDEGTADASAGIANWTERTATEAWTNPGAGTGSHDPVKVVAFEATLGEHTIPIPPELVQTWIDDDGTNHGVVFEPTSFVGTGWFFSREYDDPAVRPELTVTYIPPVAG